MLGTLKKLGDFSEVSNFFDYGGAGRLLPFITFWSFTQNFPDFTNPVIFLLRRNLILILYVINLCLLLRVLSFLHFHRNLLGRTFITLLVGILVIRLLASFDFLDMSDDLVRIIYLHSILPLEAH